MTPICRPFVSLTRSLVQVLVSPIPPENQNQQSCFSPPSSLPFVFITAACSRTRRPGPTPELFGSHRLRRPHTRRPTPTSRTRRLLTLRPLSPPDLSRPRCPSGSSCQVRTGTHLKESVLERSWRSTAASPELLESESQTRASPVTSNICKHLLTIQQTPLSK